MFSTIRLSKYSSVRYCSATSSPFRVPSVPTHANAGGERRRPLTPASGSTVSEVHRPLVCSSRAARPDPERSVAAADPVAQSRHPREVLNCCATPRGVLRGSSTNQFDPRRSRRRECGWSISPCSAGPGVAAAVPGITRVFSVAAMPDRRGRAAQVRSQRGCPMPRFNRQLPGSLPAKRCPARLRCTRTRSPNARRSPSVAEPR